MSKRALDLSTRGLLIASLPLAIAVGCATGESQPPSASIEESVPQSEFSFETYLTRIDEPRTPEVTPTAEPDPHPATEISEPAPAIGPDIASAAEKGEPVDEPEIGASAPEPTETLVKPTTPRPVSQVVYFGFDQSEVDTEDRLLLEQHAQYLLENPQTSIVISGHADNRGPKAYNEHLSELRAKRVAGVLMQLGVPEERITVEALGAEQPATDLQRWHENRRVEIEYDDAYLVMSP